MVPFSGPSSAGRLSQRVGVREGHDHAFARQGQAGEGCAEIRQRGAGDAEIKPVLGELVDLAGCGELIDLERHRGLIGADGRDLNSGKLLRYAGPAHLLTMAPTRTGKGVGTIIPNLLTLDRSVISGSCGVQRKNYWRRLSANE